MNNSTRQQQILDYLFRNRFATIDEIATAIYISTSTVRRDIKILEEKGLVKSVWGGAVLSEYAHEARPASFRDRENSVAKEEIAAKAAELIKGNETIFFDSSSTVKRICKYIQNRENLTIITNNLAVCDELKNSDIAVYCTGGLLKKKHDCFLGHYAEQFLRQVTASTFFFSSSSVLENGDIMDVSESETAIRKVMMSRAANQIFLCDSSKLGKESSFKLCNVADITKIISNSHTVEELKQQN